MPFETLSRRAMLLAFCAAPLGCASNGRAHMAQETAIQGERNLSALDAYHAAINRHDVAAARAFISEDMENFGRRVGGAGVAMVLGDVFTRFPDVQMDVQEQVAVGDQVVARTIYSGTHRGIGRLPVDGGQLVGVLPTGRQFAVQHIHWYTFRDGLIVRHWGARDDISMMMQLGLSPPIDPVSAPAVRGARIEHRNVAGEILQERNLAAIGAYHHAMAHMDIDGVAACFAENARNDGRSGGRERVRMALADVFRAFTPVSDGMGVQEIVAADDCVIVRTERTLRHTGVSQIPIDGGLLMGKPPTGRSFTQRQIEWLTLRDGLITERRACRDDIGMMVQLGFMPAPPPFPIPSQ